MQKVDTRGNTVGKKKTPKDVFRYDDEVEKQLGLLLGKLKAKGKENTFEGLKEMTDHQKKVVSGRVKKQRVKLEKIKQTETSMSPRISSVPKLKYKSPYSKVNLGVIAGEHNSLERKKKMVKQKEERLPSLYLKKPEVELKPRIPLYRIKWFAPDSEFKKNATDIQVGSELGKGAFATVYEAIDKKLEQVVAVKIFDKRMLKDASKRKDVQNELDLINKLDHPNIIKLLRIVEDINQVYIVMENWGKYTLHEYIKEIKLSPAEITSIFEQLISAVGYLHSHNIFHRDIKLNNIMVRNGVVCLLDFGLASNSNYTKEFLYCGTAAYMAPEMYLRKGYQGAPVDVWCIGVCIFKVLTGQFPFGGSSCLTETIKTQTLRQTRIPVSLRKTFSSTKPKRTSSVKFSIQIHFRE